jgi:23S rRNA pseudouridine2605 synthase
VREPKAAGERLQKALAHLGLGSRREAEAWIRAGRLTVNGEVASLGSRVHEGDQIRLDGRLVRRRPSEPGQVFVLHRSPGETLGPSSPLLARLPRVAGRRFVAVSPMPAVDGGLELVTSDGELAAQLQRAVRGLEAEFSVRVHGELSTEQLERIGEGRLDRGTAVQVLSCETVESGEGANRWYALTARGASGKDVRQLFERQGALVSRVLRTRLGPVALERRQLRGQSRRLTDAESAVLLRPH